MNRRTLLGALTMPGLAAAFGRPPWSPAAADPPADAACDPFGGVASKKGLQVQMADDAIALGVHHAGLNVMLNGLLAADSAPGPGRTVVESDGFKFCLNDKYVATLDKNVRALSDRGIVVTFILITYRSTNERIRALTVHPSASPGEGTTMAANTVTPEGRACYKALTGFLARRYSGADPSHGRVWGWVISNEVNSHFQWHQMGPATAEEVATQYEDQVRLAWTSLREHSAHARVYLSLEHHWTARGHADPARACPGRTLLELFAQRARARGDFDWNLAYHPYPANLFDPRTWRDKVTFDDNTPKVTFKNLEVLTRKLATPLLTFNGQPRRLHLTEQGFHCTDKPDGEANQSAAYAYAWEKIRRVGGIDGFLYHRQVDHSQEGGLKFGLWTNKPGSIATPDRLRPLWDLVKAAGTPAWEQAAAPHLATCGLKNWDELNPK